MTKTSIQIRINVKWNNPHPKMDWLGMETILRDILNSDMTDSDKVLASSEAIGAWTRRGEAISTPIRRFSETE